MIGALMDILNLFNAISLVIVSVGLLISIISFINVVKVLHETGFKGYGLPKVAFYSFLSALFILIAFILMILLVIGWSELEGLAFFFVMLSIVASYYSNRVLRSILNELLYA